MEIGDGQSTMTAFTAATLGQNGSIILSGDGSLGGKTVDCAYSCLSFWFVFFSFSLMIVIERIKYDKAG